MWSSSQSSKIKLVHTSYQRFTTNLSASSSSYLRNYISTSNNYNYNNNNTNNLYKCQNINNYNYNYAKLNNNNNNNNSYLCTYKNNNNNNHLININNKRLYTSNSNSSRNDSDYGYYDVQLSYEVEEDDKPYEQTVSSNDSNSSSTFSTTLPPLQLQPLQQQQKEKYNPKPTKQVNAASLPKIIKIKSSSKSSSPLPPPSLSISTDTNNSNNIKKNNNNSNDSIIQSIFGLQDSNTIKSNINNNNINNNSTITPTGLNNSQPKQQEILNLDNEEEELSFEKKKKKGKKSSQEDSDMEIDLTDEQKAIVKCIVEGGKNVFFTGSAGTGKSVVIKHTVAQLREKHGIGTVHVTAASGIAAVNIGGVTLHSFAGIGYGQGTVTQLAVGIAKRKKYEKRWRECKVLIIDEISMIDSELFDKLEQVARIFGGIQLCLCGDFFQLPPVLGNYAFESEAWHKLYSEAIDLLHKCNRPLDISNGVLPTKLYTTNADVDSENNVALAALPGETVSFTSIDSGCKELIEALDKDCPAPRELNLKVGAQVVLLRKPDGQSKLVNGSRGVVVEFVEPKATRLLKAKSTSWAEKNALVPVVLFNDGSRVRIKPSEWGIWSEKKATRQQLPLKLAWALTIHRAQGLTLDKIECRLQQAFANGQAYVALSRAKTLQEQAPKLSILKRNS
ncbi:DNA helicase [Cavenderia fasciculata]|uniref:ATP-dependent DNA helicase n=1 Tax=Cavenderia fasciculata TaxID=261658 RepID=F4PYH1_CACFS|nr:DNA helicase [Cavenderia fasciculata]EGG19237.1 DNA helicase [Cavenderia fasciculata]|eukprot:XP_004357508.1 DNA helicase [Cavenderia fasciculata]